MPDHKVETCGGCGIQHRDSAFGLFVPYLYPVQHGRAMKTGLVKDQYFCDQACLDAYCGIIRGPDGGVISEGKRYKVKQRFKDEDGASDVLNVKKG